MFHNINSQFYTLRHQLLKLCRSSTTGATQAGWAAVERCHYICGFPNIAICHTKLQGPSWIDSSRWRDHRFLEGARGVRWNWGLRPALPKNNSNSGGFSFCLTGVSGAVKVKCNPTGMRAASAAVNHLSWHWRFRYIRVKDIFLHNNHNPICALKQGFFPP